MRTGKGVDKGEGNELGDWEDELGGGDSPQRSRRFRKDFFCALSVLGGKIITDNDFASLEESFG